MNKASSQNLIQPFQILPGQSFPIGPSVQENGVNFCIFSKNATLVELLIFQHVNDIYPEQVITLDPTINKTYHYWHVFLEGAYEGLIYAYRIHGPHEPQNGHRFDASKVILDPYAKAVVFPKKFSRKALSKLGEGGLPSLKNVIADLSDYDWEGDSHPRTPFSRTVIYELHVGGFTKHSSSGVSEDKRGTFLGLVEKIPYLQELGITAVELLPVFQFDKQDAPEGLTNYWGYSPISFFAPHQSYSTSPNSLAVLDEFRDMVKALHQAGIEVILDVVYNHSGENKADGPTYSFRGIDNSIYYLLEENDNSKYKNYSGTGNTLNANQSIVRRMILSSLHFWVRDMHVDGFRFDLASILSRNEKGEPLENPPILWDIESDPILAGTKLIAEAWDAAGLYQVGNFVGDSWKEWNGRFRDDIRSFLRGDKGKVSSFVTRIIGSPDLYAANNREAEQSINFVTCHDGFTLMDLVSYNKKHNAANKEGNRDGHNDNLSWNFGVEGPTDDPEINKLRKRQIKNFLAVNMLSLGAPMLLMGDEICHSQNGNNNAYCQDNELTWIDWSLKEKNSDIFRFLKILIQKKLRRENAQPSFNMSLPDFLSQALITWHGVRLDKPDWSVNSHSIAMTITSISRKVAMHYMVNAYNKELDFELPQIIDGKKVQWKRWLDTSKESPEDICYWSEGKPISNEHYLLPGHSIAILITNLK
ncbi:Glycogen debranching enzyme [Indibacter alkaliphilus LW1]|jgi:isoamylase|uniref:Glycogen debranching enzyme n=1 Tax=Indibacter alkaliphilus (strain CCUG 57479 / KCTC 22604 / LW1) TaxID=1189612 RepID=S2D843_INDAL|nr:glycogen debranching protein GlgX [Indibacter alkaliphilus]EOZ95387.1 Glycogen debranching enzyme [Indibacter alkaliphilus LW1]